MQPLKNQVLILVQSLYSYSALTNVFSDLAVVILPLPFVWALNLNLQKRLATIAIFLTAAVYVKFFAMLLSLLITLQRDCGKHWANGILLYSRTYFRLHL